MLYEVITLNKDVAIVVASEIMTKYCDWTDRATCVLFGDGAGAVVLKRSEVAHLLHPILSATPDVDDVIVVKKENRDTPFSGPVESPRESIRMKGADVFTYAAAVMETTLTELKERCGDQPYNKVVPHQANEKIIDFAVRTMKLSRDNFFVDIANYANTSSASIPIALCDALESGWLNAGDRVAIVGFGSGLTSGGAVIVITSYSIHYTKLYDQDVQHHDRRDRFLKSLHHKPEPCPHRDSHQGAGSEEEIIH